MNEEETTLTPVEGDPESSTPTRRRDEKQPIEMPGIHSVQQENVTPSPQQQITLTPARLILLVETAVANAREQFQAEKHLESGLPPAPQVQIPPVPGQEAANEPSPAINKRRADKLEHLDDARRRVMEPVRKEQKGTPFFANIVNEELPINFRRVTFEYSGKMDQYNHVCRFNNTASLHQFSDAIKCRVFITTLTGPAHQWFAQLPDASINNYEQLSAEFLNHFPSARKQKHTTMSFFSVKQQDNETLREYVRKFTTALLKIPITSEDILISAFTRVE